MLKDSVVMHSVILSTTFLINHVTDHPKTACQPFCNVTMFNQHIHSVPFINTQETKLCRPHLQFTKRTEMFQGVLPLNLWCQPIVLKCSSPVYRYLREDEFQCQCTGCHKKNCGLGVTSKTSQIWLTVAIFRKWQDSSVALWIKIAVILNWR